MKWENKKLQKISATVAAACVLTLAAGPFAHADYKIVQKTTIQNPQITAMVQSMQPEQRAMMERSGMGALMSGAPIPMVFYSHGREARVDFGPETLIVNAANHTQTTISRATHTYSVSTYHPNASVQVHGQVHPTGQSKIIAGHRAQRYQVAFTNPAMPGASMTGSIWGAPDLPQPPVLALGTGPASQIASEYRKIKGMPLEVDLTMNGSSIGKTTVHSITTSISTVPLPASVFAVPTGYQKTASAAPTPHGLP